MSKYTVHTGHMLRNSRGFDKFAEALAYYIERINDDQQPELLGECHSEDEDGRDDGLTDVETDCVLEADCLRESKRVAS